jgi:NAD+ diphosphatase
MGCTQPGCGFVHWDNPLPVVAGIVEHEGEIVLVRAPSWPEKFFGLVTGFLERDETPEQGIVREVAEELSLTGEVVAPVGVYAFPMRNEVIMAYHLRATGEISLSDELAGYKRVSVEKLRPWPMGTGLAVADFLKTVQARAQ